VSDLPAILSDESAFIAALEAAGCAVKGKTCTCPFHEDKNPSAQWSQGQDGTWRMFCHVCVRHANVIDLKAHAAGQDPRQAFKDAANVSRDGSEKKPAKSNAKAPAEDVVLLDKGAVKRYAERLGSVEAWHTYGPKATPVLVVARIVPPTGKKTFRQFSPHQGGWVPRNLIESGRIPLYRAVELTDRVLVVEGEKCADAAWSVGVPATTSAMGAGKAAESDWSSLLGKTAFLWPDNDDTGRKHMADVREILAGLGVATYLINTDGIGLPAKGDVADLIAALDSKTTDEIATTINGIMDDAAPQGASRELSGLFDDIQAGRFTAIPWPGLEMVGSMSKALLPGCITTLCADPGAGKSLLVIQMLAAWHRSGVSVAMLALEDERRIHLQRILAQTIGMASLTDDEWVRANAERAHAMVAASRDDLDAIGARIKAEGEDQMKLDEIANWIEMRAKAGCRVIVVDPVTAATTEREPWAADTAFLMRVKKIARTHGASVVLVTHPRGASKGAALGGMAGGSAYPRFSHVALWLEKFDMQERRASDGELATCNRSIKITKSRHGKGGGMTIGCIFDVDTLRFGNQCGLAPDDDKPKRRNPAIARPNPKASAQHQAERLRQPIQQSEDLFMDTL
jgi:archaellum biogenesis ATPase FlaH